MFQEKSEHRVYSIASRRVEGWVGLGVTKGRGPKILSKIFQKSEHRTIAEMRAESTSGGCSSSW